MARAKTQQGARGAARVGTSGARSGGQGAARVGAGSARPGGRPRTGARADETVRFTVSLPRVLLSDLDRRMIARGYASRSELVRDLVREQLVQEKWLDEGSDVVGVLTICYDHHQRNLPDRIMHLQHRAFVHILCTTHIHLDHEHCLEAIFIRGRPAQVEKLSLAIGGLRGVKFSRLTKASKVQH